MNRGRAWPSPEPPDCRCAAASRWRDFLCQSASRQGGKRVRGRAEASPMPRIVAVRPPPSKNSPSRLSPREATAPPSTCLPQPHARTESGTSRFGFASQRHRLRIDGGRDVQPSPNEFVDQRLREANMRVALGTNSNADGSRDGQALPHRLTPPGKIIDDQQVRFDAPRQGDRRGLARVKANDAWPSPTLDGIGKDLDPARQTRHRTTDLALDGLWDEQTAEQCRMSPNRPIWW